MMGLPKMIEGLHGRLGGESERNDRMKAVVEGIV